MAQAGGLHKRKRASAKNRPAEDSGFVGDAFVQIVAAVEMYVAARTAAWSRKRLPATARGLKSAKLRLSKQMTKQIDRIQRSAIPLTRREKTAVEYVVENAAKAAADAEEIDIDTWTVFRCADEGDTLRDTVMNINLAWMMERILLSQKG